MKRILLACGLLAATCSFSYAQSTAPVAPVVSKTEFTTQVNQMNTFLTSNKVEDAQRKWDDVHKTMLNTLSATKYKIRAAQEANNQEEVRKLMEVMTKQRELYGEILQMARGDMAGNKTQLKTKLTEFGSSIL